MSWDTNNNDDDDDTKEPTHCCAVFMVSYHGIVVVEFVEDSDNVSTSTWNNATTKGMGNCNNSGVGVGAAGGGW